MSVHTYACASVCPQKVSLITVKFDMYVEIDDWCTTVCSMTRSKVKVTSPLKLEIRPFSKAIFSFIYNGSWQLTTDFQTTCRAQYLNLLGRIFDILLSFCVTWLWSWHKHPLRGVNHQSPFSICAKCIADVGGFTFCISLLRSHFICILASLFCDVWEEHYCCSCYCQI